MIKEQHKETRNEVTLKLNGGDVISYLHKLGVIPESVPEQGFSISNIKIEFEVPRRGDYSGSDVEFYNEDRLKISWDEVQTH